MNNGFDSKVLDLNLEAQLYLLAKNRNPSEIKAPQASVRLHKNLQTIRTLEIFGQRQNYQRVVKEINRILSINQCGIYISLQNIEYPDLFAHRSEDLQQIYENPQLDFFFDFNSRYFPQLIDRDKPVVIGISMVYLNQALSVFGLLGYLNQNYPSIKIVVGGSLVGCWEPLAAFAKLKEVCPQISWISGAGESHLLKIVTHSVKKTKKTGTDLYNINNSGTDLYQPPTQAPPNFNSVKDLPYFAPGFILPYSLSVGCFYKKCRFCPECLNPEPFMTQRFSQARNELDKLVSKYQPVLIHFIDNALSLPHLRGLAIHDLKVPWYGYSRFLPELSNEDFVRGLAKNRCAMLQLGLETGSQKVLNQLEKRIRLRDVDKILKNLKQAGILTYVYLLFGTPCDGEKEAEETLKLVKKLSPYIDFLNLSIFYLPHQFVQDFKVEENQFSNGDLSLYTDFRHPQAWGRREIRDFLNNRFKKEPEIKAILDRTPPYFTSNHAAFQNRQVFSK